MNPMETHGAVSWIEHSGPNTAEARSFYESVLGWAVVENDMPGGTYPAIVLGEKPIGGFSPIPGSEGWKVYVTVDDVDARLEKAKACGAKIASEPVTVAGVGRMATITDPFGANLCLIDYSKS